MVERYKDAMDVDMWFVTEIVAHLRDGETHLKDRETQHRQCKYTLAGVVDVDVWFLTK